MEEVKQRRFVGGPMHWKVTERYLTSRLLSVPEIDEVGWWEHTYAAESRGGEHCWVWLGRKSATFTLPR